MCCSYMINKEDHDKYHVGQCSECGCDVDIDGDSVERDNCPYSPIICQKCGYRPCDGSC